MPCIVLQLHTSTLIISTQIEIPIFSWYMWAKSCSTHTAGWLPSGMSTPFLQDRRQSPHCCFLMYDKDCCLSDTHNYAAAHKYSDVRAKALLSTKRARLLSPGKGTKTLWCVNLMEGCIKSICPPREQVCCLQGMEAQAHGVYAWKLRHTVYMHACSL